MNWHRLDSRQITTLRQPKRLAKEGVYKKQYKPVSPNSRKLSTPDFVELYQWIELNTTVSCETQVVNGCPSFEDCLGMPIQSVLGQEMDLGKKNDTKYESKPFPWLTYVRKVKQVLIQRNKIIPDELNLEETILEMHRQHAKQQRAAIDHDIASCGVNEVAVSCQKRQDHSIRWFSWYFFYLNYTRDAIPIKATGLPTDDPDKWDTIIESFRLKTRNHPEKEFPEAVPHFRSGTSEQTLNQIKIEKKGYLRSKEYHKIAPRAQNGDVHHHRMTK
ncbi:hypothetical protein BLNAU_23520 [Blattamonas nauphoetae]|uniref:Uncharacterized protein n=1 Tax=Blattamonas nauphoetae TaxID=2049346 RepID=A0ABQ9WR44_9EUKA|nr:hypothetical protein BLNAU_23520 [Blattamonas nauphoetae]